MPAAREASFDKISKTEGDVLLKALKKDGRYAPQKLVETLREIREQRLLDPEIAPEIVVDPFADPSEKS